MTHTPAALKPLIPQERRGVALIMVLVTIALLASITAVASNSARTSAQVSVSLRAASIARAMAENGIIAATAQIDHRLVLLSADSARRDEYLSDLEPATSTVRPLAFDSIGDGVFIVTVVDVSSRLDVNEAGAEGWRLFLRPQLGDIEALRIAQIIDAKVRGEGNDSSGSEFALRSRRPFETLDDLLIVPGISADLLARIAPMLTVDGNGTINRQAAPLPVLAAASGSVIDHPARLLLISRGWMKNHPLTREIQAVYDIYDDGLRLVRWREFER